MCANTVVFCCRLRLNALLSFGHAIDLPRFHTTHTCGVAFAWAPRTGHVGWQCVISAGSTSTRSGSVASTCVCFLFFLLERPRVVRFPPSSIDFERYERLALIF